MSWGDGIGLDGEFDLQVDSSGDIAIFSEMQEVEKDLSLLLITNLSSGILGQPATPQTSARLRIQTRNILISDERVESVTEPEVIETPNFDELVVQCEVTLTDGTVTAVTTDN